MTTQPSLLSIVVPVYNEAAGLAEFHRQLTAVLDGLAFKSEIIYCDDGSRDGTTALIGQLAGDKRVRLVKLSRNFGKEIASAAGLAVAGGICVISLDGDGQHPVELIPQLIKKWQAGARLVIGVRVANHKEGLVKRLGSKLFYRWFNRLTGSHLLPGATDFRLIDQVVQADLVRLGERHRITRGLVDWLGYQPDYLYFQAHPRTAGQAGYSFKKLAKLAVDSVISLSTSPLYIAAWCGAAILASSLLLGLAMLVNLLLGDRLGLHATGSAYMGVLLLFLVGILLLSQGIIGLYLSHIHAETQNRPLYIVDKQASIRLS